MPRAPKPLTFSVPESLLMLLLAVWSSSAAAAWVAIGGNDVSNTYADPATIRKAGDKVKMRHLVDFNSVQLKASGRRYLSEKLQYEYDCKQEQARMLNFSSHSGNMGAGAMVEGEFRPGKWEPLPPGSLVAYLRKFACAKQ